MMKVTVQFGSDKTVVYYDDVLTIVHRTARSYRLTIRQRLEGVNNPRIYDVVVMDVKRLMVHE